MELVGKINMALCSTELVAPIVESDLAHVLRVCGSPDSWLFATQPVCQAEK